MVWDGKKTICLDFDGVIHLYSSPWKGHHIIEDDPHPQAFEMIMNYLDHFNVVVYSARSSDDHGIGAMKDWFIQKGLNEDVLDKISFSNTKPAAAVYIDDRGWQFDGTWPSVDQLKDFEPWNKKKAK